jgi:DNA-binding CsgD family transcriptional regulator
MGAVERRFAPWLDLASAFASRPAASLPRHTIAAELAATFGSQVSWNWMNPDGDHGFDLHTPIPGWPTPEIVARLDVMVSHHPLISWFAASGQVTPMSIGRVPLVLVSRLGREIVNEHLVPVSMEQQLSIPYRLAPRHHRAFILGRGGDDFSDEDLEVAMRIQTLLLLLDRQCAVLRGYRGESAIPLTGRELTVLRLLSDGLTSSAIGRRLAISPRTVHQHLQNIYRKLGVSDRLRAVLLARESGLLQTPESSTEPEIDGNVTVRVFAIPDAYPDFDEAKTLPTPRDERRPSDQRVLAPAPVGGA